MFLQAIVCGTAVSGTVVSFFRVVTKAASDSVTGLAFGACKYLSTFQLAFDVICLLILQSRCTFYQQSIKAQKPKISVYKTLISVVRPLARIL